MKLETALRIVDDYIGVAARGTGKGSVHRLSWLPHSKEKITAARKLVTACLVANDSLTQKAGENIIGLAHWLKRFIGEEAANRIDKTLEIQGNKSGKLRPSGEAWKEFQGHAKSTCSMEVWDAFNDFISQVRSLEK